MQEQPEQESQHEILEADIEKLVQEVKRLREHPETKGLSEQELLKKSIQKVVPITSQAPAPQKFPPSPLPDYAEGAPAETKLEIERLLEITFHKGLKKAHEEAQKAQPFVIDAFHDALVGKLYPEFKKRGILK